MDYHDIFISCRVGDLEKVKYLVETRDVELNIRDKWDTTPLYYACLCGHEQVVKYLLENGAKCEANTFDGERCLYAALNDSIKKMLKNYKMITSTTMRRDVYDEFLRRLQSDNCYTDATFKVIYQKFNTHRCILAARCPDLHEKLKQRLDNGKTISIKDHRIEPATFVTLLDYIYLGRMRVSFENISSLILLAKQCHMESLVHQLEKKLKDKKSFECSKPGVHVAMFSIESEEDKERLRFDLGRLADKAVPNEFRPILAREMPFTPVESQILPDICFMVNGSKFLCHRTFFCIRSDYFKALLEDHFDENSSEQIVTIHLHDITTDIFLAVLYYVYTDTCKLYPETVYEVLYKADIYLLPGLKRHCSTYIGGLIDDENVFSVLQISRLFTLPKLEDQCTEFIAENIEEMVSRKEFCDIIIQDAQSIKERQESDSIDIVDSVRYHLTSHVQTYSEILGANHKLTLIDQLLDVLGFDC